jgi:glycerophosphoryl diester phosphodiesterase
MKPPRPKIVCHRGACRLAPENTLASARAALAEGGDIVEIDVRQAADGSLWLMHDATVDRTTNGSGALAALTAPRIEALDAGAWFAPRFAGEPVPRLDRFLAELRGLCGVYVEVKQADAEAVARTIALAALPDEVFTYSEDAAQRAALRAAAPGLRRMTNRRDVADLDAALAVEQAQILEFHAGDFSPEAVAAAHARGLAVMVYTDAPDRDLFAAALAAGADYLNTDFPAMVRALRDA